MSQMWPGIFFLIQIYPVQYLGHICAKKMYMLFTKNSNLTGHSFLYSLLFLEHNKLAPTSRPLCWLFPLLWNAHSLIAFSKAFLNTCPSYTYYLPFFLALILSLCPNLPGYIFCLQIVFIVCYPQ